MKITKEQEERFWSKVKKTNTCWLWVGASTRGYGKLYVDKVFWRAPRLAYTLLVGEIPKGLELDHLCRNVACVNPAHLEPVTHTVNLERGNTLSGIMKRTGKCRRGHAMTEENTERSNDGKTRCRQCGFINHAVQNAKRKWKRELKKELQSLRHEIECGKDYGLKELDALMERLGLTKQCLVCHETPEPGYLCKFHNHAPDRRETK